MELFVGLLVALVAAAGFVFQAFLFRLFAGWFAGVWVPWGSAFVVVVIAAILQGLFTTALSLATFGMDLGLCGALSGYLVWTAMLAWLTDLRFTQALVVGLAMTVVSWLLFWGLLLLLIATGLAAALGLAGLAAGA